MLVLAGFAPQNHAKLAGIRQFYSKFAAINRNQRDVLGTSIHVVSSTATAATTKTPADKHSSSHDSIAHENDDAMLLKPRRRGTEAYWHKMNLFLTAFSNCMTAEPAEARGEFGFGYIWPHLRPDPLNPAASSMVGCPDQSFHALPPTFGARNRLRHHLHSLLPWLHHALYVLQPCSF